MMHRSVIGLLGLLCVSVASAPGQSQPLEEQPPCCQSLCGVGTASEFFDRGDVTVRVTVTSYRDVRAELCVAYLDCSQLECWEKDFALQTTPLQTETKTHTLSQWFCGDLDFDLAYDLRVSNYPMSWGDLGWMELNSLSCFSGDDTYDRQAAFDVSVDWLAGDPNPTIAISNVQLTYNGDWAVANNNCDNGSGTDPCTDLVPTVPLTHSTSSTYGMSHTVTLQNGGATPYVQIKAELVSHTLTSCNASAAMGCTNVCGECVPCDAGTATLSASVNVPNYSFTQPACCDLCGCCLANGSQISVDLWVTGWCANSELISLDPMEIIGCDNLYDTVDVDWVSGPSIVTDSCGCQWNVYPYYDDSECLWCFEFIYIDGTCPGGCGGWTEPDENNIYCPGNFIQCISDPDPLDDLCSSGAGGPSDWVVTPLDVGCHEDSGDCEPCCGSWANSVATAWDNEDVCFAIATSGQLAHIDSLGNYMRAVWQPSTCNWYIEVDFDDWGAGEGCDSVESFLTGYTPPGEPRGGPVTWTSQAGSEEACWLGAEELAMWASGSFFVQNEVVVDDTTYSCTGPVAGECDCDSDTP